MPLFSQKSNNDDGKENNGGEHMLEHFVSMDKDASEEHAYRKLKQLLSPFVLRRKKSDVLSQLLPPKVSIKSSFEWQFSLLSMFQLILRIIDH